MRKIFAVFFLTTFYFCWGQAKITEPVFPTELMVITDDETSSGPFFLVPRRQTMITSNFIRIRNYDKDWQIVKTAENKISFGSYPINNSWKWSVKGKESLENEAKVVREFKLTFLTLPINAPAKTKINQQYKTLIFKSSALQIEKKWGDHPDLIWVDLNRKATEESLIRKHDLTVNDVLFSHSLYSDQYGTEVSIKEQTFNINDIDIEQSAELTELSSSATTDHATDMATLIGGLGVSFKTGKGVSVSSLYATSFDNLFPEELRYYQQYGIKVENHSYGVGVENFYGVEAQAYDQFTFENPEVLHIFSSGNAGGFTALEGNYAGLQQISNLTGTFKQSKNTLTVGAIDSIYQLKTFSSRGPTFDGRVKPELVAYGGDGSSDAAAIVSGIAAYMQGYTLRNYGSTLTSEQLKALLIAGAEDVGASGPDYFTGFGNASLSNSLTIQQNDWHISDSVSEFDEQIYTIEISRRAKNFRVVLYWHDPAAAINEPHTLMNDLALSLTSTAPQVYQPLVLSNFPHIDSLMRLARPGLDHKNNVELIALDEIEEGTYEINISANELTTSSQSYTVAYFMETNDSLFWTYPTSDDVLLSNEETIIRWNSTLESETGQLFVQIDGGEPKLLDATVDLQLGLYSYSVPDTVANVRFFIETDRIFLSDAILVHPLINPEVLLLCQDSIALTWPKVGAASDILVYDLSFVISAFEAEDSLGFLSRSQFSSDFLAIQPFFEGIAGERSYALNYTQQGIGCYISNVIARKFAQSIELEINLNAWQVIDEVRIEKTSKGVMTEVFSTNPSGPIVSFVDRDLKTGIIEYQVNVTLSSGREISFEKQTVYYANARETIVGPVPANRSAELSVITDALGGVFQIISPDGKIQLNWPIVNTIEYLPLSNLKSGIYFYRVTLEGSIRESGKIIIE
ncbi:MAG: hypothetical protein ACI92W_002580 [Paraglaciecola sp.]